MAKKTANSSDKKSINIIWNFLISALLYGLICYFNGPDKQHELDYETVKKVAMTIAVVWFFVNLIIVTKQGYKFTIFPKSRKKGKKKDVVKQTGKKAAETYILKDSATGAERLFIKDENGQWVSEDGQSVLDMDDVSRFNNQRADDRKWINKENEKIKNNETALDEQLRKIDEQAELENARLQKELEETLKRIEKYGTMDDDVEHLKEIIRRQQRLDEIVSSRNIRKGNLADIGYKVASTTKYATDKAMDIIAKTTGTAGKAGKAIYTGLTDQASALTDAYVNDKDMIEASKKAGVDSVVSIAEDNLSGGTKYVGTVAGEAVRDMGKAIIEGKEGTKVLTAGLEGSGRGLFKANAEVVGENAGSLFSEGGSELYLSSKEVTGIFVDNSDIVSTTVQDLSNAAYEEFGQHVEELNKHRKK